MRASLLLLLAGCVAVSAYYVPGTYPQEFLPNAGVSGKLHLLLEQDEGVEGCLHARAQLRAFRRH
jgi:hypothetical protein